MVDYEGPRIDDARIGERHMNFIESSFSGQMMIVKGAFTFIHELVR